jgi:hypothetical protein
LVRKQVEEELRAEHNAELETIKAQLVRQRDQAIQSAAKLAQFEKDQEITRQRKVSFGSLSILALDGVS